MLGELIMAEFIIDECIKETFEFYKNFCSYVSEDCDSEFDEPATLEKIEQWEKENNTELPHQYKSWLLLTSGCNLFNNTISMRFPKLGCMEEKDDIIIVGCNMGTESQYYIKRDTGTACFFCDSLMEETEFDSVEELLYEIIYDGECEYSDYLDEGWEDDFNNKYGY